MANLTRAYRDDNIDRLVEKYMHNDATTAYNNALAAKTDTDAEINNILAMARKAGIMPAGMGHTPPKPVPTAGLAAGLTATPTYTMADLTKMAAMFEAAGVEANKEENHGFRIVVVAEGFVYAGFVTMDRHWVKIEKAVNLRKWGTTKGLGQLAIEGPNSNSEIDDVGTIDIPRNALISLVHTDHTKWGH